MDLPDEMIFASPAVDYGQRLPDRFTQAGKGVSPPLVVGNLPDQIVEVMVIMDAPGIRVDGRARVHWTIWGLTGTDIEMEAGEIPEDAVQGENDFDTVGYTGPTAEQSTTYRFRAFVLDAELGLNSGAGPETVLDAIDGHILEAELFEVRYP